MTCLHCKDTMTQSTTSYFTDLGTSMVIIKNVPCLTCPQCGEVAYTARIVEALQKMIKGVKNSLLEVAIINYAETAA